MTDFAKLRWLGVWLPVLALGALIGVVGFVTFSFDPDQPAHILAYAVLMAVIALGAYLFSHSIFRLVQQKEAEILRRNQELATLNEVGAIINESPSFDGMLSQVLDKVLEVTGAESAQILLREEGARGLALGCFRGLHPDAFHGTTRFAPGEDLCGRIVEQGKTIVVEDLRADSRFDREAVLAKGFRSYVGVPLASQGEVVGILEVLAIEQARPRDEDVGLLEALGNQVGVAIENARLSTQLKTMSVMEERHRIAREMHDGLAQELGYIYLKLGELEVSPSRNGAQAEIRTMKGVAARAYEEVRHAIFGLKTMVSRGLGLIPTLAEYLHEFGEQTGIAAELTVVNEEATRFSPQVEIQLIRIVQEALSNVRKHAHGSRAEVIFQSAEGSAKITIQDDGRGFEPEEAARPGRATFGLQTMRERAESAGGHLEIRSVAGKGTRVIAALPLLGKENVQWIP